MKDQSDNPPVLTRETTWRPVWAERPRTTEDSVMFHSDITTVRYIAAWEQVERFVTDWTVVDPQPEQMEVGHGPGTIIRD